MNRRKMMMGFAGGLLGLLVVGCSSPAGSGAGVSSSETDDSKVQRLTSDLRLLGAEVDPHEARGVAETAVHAARELAGEYRMVKPAFVHNMLVNMNWRERGLCFHWADDLQDRLLSCGFRTLQLHRVVSGINTPREHNALVVTKVGQAMKEGLVLDGWRKGGDLFWGPVKLEKKYRWEIRTDFPWMKSRREDGDAVEEVGQERTEGAKVP